MQAPRFSLTLSVVFCLTVPLSTAHAQEDSTRSPWMDAEARQNAQLSASRQFDLPVLEKRLRPVIIGAYPDAKVEFTGTDLIVSYSSDKYSTHLRDSNGQLSTEAPEKFPADFSEFSLRVSVYPDVTHYKPLNPSSNSSEPFGTTYFSDYNLKEIELNELGDVPLGYPAYRDYYLLARAGLLRDPYSGGDHVQWIMLRYEFAVDVAQLLKSPKAKDAEKNRATARALAALKGEFAPEISRLGIKVTPPHIIRGLLWQPTYQRFQLTFSYGRGVPPMFVERIKQIIANYAEETFEANTSPGNAFVRED